MKILICDDEQQYIDELKTHVEKFMQCRFVNYVIHTANNPQEVVESNEIYQLVFLDIQMDNLDGISLAKILKKRNSKVAIFFVTSFNDYQDDAMDLRAFRFFEKPFNADRLYSGLEEAINRRGYIC